MNEKFFSIDIRRSYEYTFEGQSKHLEIEYCETHTYTFQTDEGYRYVFLVDELGDLNKLDNFLVRNFVYIKILRIIG